MNDPRQLERTVPRPGKALTGADFGRRIARLSAPPERSAKFFAHRHCPAATHRRSDPKEPTHKIIPSQLVLALSHFGSHVQLSFFNPTAAFGQEKKNMKRFRKFREPRFAHTTLQNPTWEVRTRARIPVANRRRTQPIRARKLRPSAISRTRSYFYG
jgi:hypothetical protein